MAQDLAIHAPMLWELLDRLLGGNGGVDLASMHVSVQSEDTTTGKGDDGEYWDEIDEIDLEGFINGLTSETSRCNGRQRRRAAAILIKKATILGILMQGMNQKANALQSVIGFFLQSSHTPQKVIETLSHIGISVSVETIAAAVRSLSAESQIQIQELGQSLLACYAYDNFDVDLKSHVPLAEKSMDTLKHLTSGLLFRLEHGVTMDDLKCSEEIWKKSPLNPSTATAPVTKLSWRDLLSLHPECGVSSWHDLTRHERFNSWLFLMDLCTYGPQYFHQFRAQISDPEAIEEIPLIKTEIVPARAMDVNNSTVSGNIHAVIDLLAQGGIYNPTEASARKYDTPDISEHVVLVHGDLGTGERLQAAQLRRSIEATPWDRFQHIIFIPGLFHLKMACADAMWRCFIQPLSAREDETCLMRDIAVLRPKETGIYCSKPGFRRMHQAIGHAGVCRRLDCWRVQVNKTYPSITTLDAFAASQPTFDGLQKMADELSLAYVANQTLVRMRRRPHKERDVQYENSLLLNKYFFLYEELSYAMNRGDIGRVETCIIPWIPILKALGKHKYATHMTTFLLNVHFIYPEGLRRAIRYHMLINPTGKAMKWRAVDWCVELNNLFTKVKYGGKGVNRTVERILLESPLVQTYRMAQSVVQKSFLHTHLSAKHADPNMAKTFNVLLTRLMNCSPHIFIPGRSSRFEVPNLTNKGRAMEKTVQGDIEIVATDATDTDQGSGIAMEDVLVELL
ncbi:hypothetical protein EDD15DRAFT_2381285 [Pisolithus albus]|nr:hypothetical protein EDD15DRAFT_2381285 [Pisolithus albus]